MHSNDTIHTTHAIPDRPYTPGGPQPRNAFDGDLQAIGGARSRSWKITGVYHLI